MNIVDKYINSSIWFNVVKITNCKRKKIDDPFTKAFTNINENSLIIEFDCNNKYCLYNIKAHYNKLYFKFKIDNKEYSILVFNAVSTYSFISNNILSVEFTAEDVIINNIEVQI